MDLDDSLIGTTTLLLSDDDTSSSSPMMSLEDDLPLKLLTDDDQFDSSSASSSPRLPDAHRFAAFSLAGAPTASDLFSTFAPSMAAAAVAAAAAAVAPLNLNHLAHLPSPSSLVLPEHLSPQNSDDDVFEQNQGLSFQPLPISVQTIASLPLRKEQLVQRAQTPPPPLSPVFDNGTSDCQSQDAGASGDDPTQPIIPRASGPRGRRKPFEDMSPDERARRKRLDRKAQLARAARHKKRARLGELEQEVAELKGELERARKQRKLDLEQLQSAAKTRNLNLKMEAEFDVASTIASVRAAVASLSAGPGTHTFSSRQVVLDKIQTLSCEARTRMHLRSLLPEKLQIGSTEESFADPVELFRNIFAQENPKAAIAMPDFELSADQQRKLYAVRSKFRKHNDCLRKLKCSLARVSSLMEKERDLTARNMNILRDTLSDGAFSQMLVWLQTQQESQLPSRLTASSS